MESTRMELTRERRCRSATFSEDQVEQHRSQQHKHHRHHKSKLISASTTLISETQQQQSSKSTTTPPPSLLQPQSLPAETTTRVSIFRNGNNNKAKVVRISKSLEWHEFLKLIGQKLELKGSACKVFSNDGAEIDDISLIDNNDTLFITSETSEHFIPLSNFTPAPSYHSATSALGTTTNFEMGRTSSIGSIGCTSISDWVSLNVGGKIFATTRTTLTKYRGSMLATVSLFYCIIHMLLNPFHQTI